MTQSQPKPQHPDKKSILDNVRAALTEDVGSGDITAALIPDTIQATARVITREDGVLCGRAWVDQVFTELDSQITIHWHANDGDLITADQQLTPVWHGHYMPSLRQHGRRYQSQAAGHPQNHTGIATGTEIRRYLRRLLQPSHGAL